MIETKMIYKTRKEEIDLCYSILLDLQLDEQPRGQTLAIDKIHTERFAPVLKSNILLMLYNLVEACVTNGFLEIYDCIKNNRIVYNQLVKSIQDIWSNYEIGKAHKTTANQITYERQVQSIISTVITDGTIELGKEALSISGNLDARAIRKLLRDHDIRIADQSDKLHMLTMKKKRNALAHGEESFGNCAREITISQLGEIKDEVLSFILDVLNCLSEYYEQQLFRKTSSSIPP
ncbi:MAG: hypothetical protein LBC74_12740 [Planctomycetaceae bacterium]|jgi:hypothetical protein|nr:hypothetical protein [Planctomycetaceae bacterium]